MRSKPDGCHGCACHDHGTDFSAIEGTGSSGILIVGEASGLHEQREQLPFRPFAPAGGVLERAFRRMGVSRQQFAITNILRCRPRNDWFSKAPWEFSAARHCRPNLAAALAEFKPRAVWTLGNISMRELTGYSGVAEEYQSISYLTGYCVPLVADFGAGPLPVIPGFHPAYLRRGKMSHFEQLCRTLQRTLNVVAGKDRAYDWEPQKTMLRYDTHPTVARASEFYFRLRDNPGLAFSYDLETGESASLDEDARDGYVDTQIRLVQFSAESGTAIAMPWEGDFKRIVQSILHLPNVKMGHNVWLFDNKVLAACGDREGLDLRPRGVVHDTLCMFHHWQPDLPAHLQFAASFVQFPFPWKHLAATDIEFYGCCDVDATLRLYGMLEATLRRDGLWDDGAVAA